MRAKLRGILVLGYVAISMPILFLFCLPPMLLTGSGDFSIWLARVFWSPSILRLAGVHLDIERLADIPEGPAIYASNHESALDIFALLIAVPRNLRFIAKRELFRIPVFGWYLRLAGFVEVDRRNRSQALASLRQAAAMVRGGTSLIAFPEGTRSRDGRVHPFKKGSFVLALEAQVPIVPIAISGAGAITPKKRVEVHPGKVRLSIGRPVVPAELPDRNALLKEVRRRIIEQHRALGGLGGDVEDAVAAPGFEGLSRGEVEKVALSAPHERR